MCGGGLPRNAAFCPHCGSRVADEAVPSPAPAEPQLYGVTPPMTLLALALAVLAVGVVLVVRDRAALGAVLIGLALVLAGAFVAAARRRPDGAVAQASASGVDRMRERARLTRTSLSARAGARRELGRLLREREELRAGRKRLVEQLGRAVYAGDDAATQSLRAELEELESAYASKEAEMQAVTERAREQVQQALFEAQSTEMVEIPGDPGTQPPTTVPEPVPVPSPPPGPATVPEPTPPPIPEPTPVPHEPPIPPAIPEPFPAPSPPPGQPEPAADAPRGRARRKRS